MDTERMDPEVEPLHFDVDLADLPPDVKEVVEEIKKVAEKLLYHWKHFPIILPHSVTEFDHTELGRGRRDGVISFNELFVAPAFDELEEVAQDENGRSKILNDDQMLSIRRRGEFEVKSKNFPGQVHRWRLTLLLQKGTERAHETLLNDMALSLRLLIITARNRFCSHFFSLSQSLESIKTGLWQILDILIGMPSTTPGALYEKLHEEHSRFLVAELNVKSSNRDQWSNFCDYIKDSIKAEQETNRDTHTRGMSSPAIPYSFMTPKGAEIDLRLFNRDLMQKCSIILKKILEKESKGWYVKYKDRLITELKDQNLSYEEISRHVNEAIKEEYLRRVFNSVQNSQELEDIQPAIGKLLVDQAVSALIMEKSLEKVRERLYKHQEEHKKMLIENYPVRSRIKAWQNERLQVFEEEFIEQNQWAAHESSLAECNRSHLEQAVYFLHRDLIYLRDREPVLRKELGKVKIPNRIFTFSTRIWLPQNWIIMQHTYEGTEIIPTVIKDTPIADSKRNLADQTLYYSAQKYRLKKTSTQYPFWRWVNYFYRTLSWTWNAMFGLGVVVPWYSSISLRALFYKKPFIARLTVNQTDGSLCPDSRSLTPTFMSRLHDLWANVRLSREKFEAEPDTGFLGKSCTRHLNRFWNYVVKGGIGSMALVLLMVPLCFGGSLVSAVAAVTAPIWMPVVTICSQIISVLFYDFDHPRGNAIMYLFEAIVYRLFILGLLQPTCALITAVLFLPVASFFVLVAGLLKRGARAVWDAFMFHAVIKKRGRVPSRDGFVARRIEGPGLASNYFFQIQPAQALAAVEARIELHELTTWNHNTMQTIQKPLEEYRRFVHQCFGPFSAALCYNGVYQKLDEEVKQILNELQEACDRRKSYLNTGLNDDIRRRIKLSSRELKVTIAQTAKMLEDFYPEHIIDRLPQSADEFWESRHLENNDWQGLATQLLTEIFSSSFLTPLEDTDNCFKLQVEHMSLTRYIEMLKSAEFRDDLDIVNTVHTPKGDIDVDAPYVELYVFSPRKERVNYESTFMSRRSRKVSRYRPWKKHTVLFKEIEKLQIPLPIPHPTVICVLIHNRDNDQEPIDMDDPMCQEIFRAAEQLIYVEPPPLSGTDTFDTETSTPDRGTNSEPDVQLSHLAEQESCAFSDDNVRSMSADSMLEPAILETSQASANGSGRDEATAAEMGRQEDSGSEQVGSRVMYHEDEANTSCILQMESEDGEEEEEEDGEDGETGDVRLKLVGESVQSSDDSAADDDDDDDGDNYGENYEDTGDISEAFSRMLSSKTGTF